MFAKLKAALKNTLDATLFKNPLTTACGAVAAACQALQYIPQLEDYKWALNVGSVLATGLIGVFAADSKMDQVPAEGQGE
jgi:hypothetical membrane protein